MSAFEVVLVVVAVLAILVACTRYFRTRNVASELGGSPQSFAHPEDGPVDDHPSEDERDQPLPRRPLRGRG